MTTTMKSKPSALIPVAVGFVVTIGSMLNFLGCSNGDEADENQGEPDASSGLDDCAETITTTPVGWIDMTSLGQSAEQAFATVPGTCTAPLTWDGSGAAPIGVTPLSGESAVTATVALDQTTARLVETAPECGDPYLAVDGTASVQSADRTFDEAGAVTAVYNPHMGTVLNTFTVPSGELGGSMIIGPLAENQKAWLSFLVGPVGESCAGDIRIGFHETMGDGTAVDGEGPLGSWTDTGCPVGQTPIDLNVPIGSSPPVLDGLKAIWGDLTMSGTWELERQTTELSVRGSVTNPVACMDKPIASVPVDITYGTADDRLLEHVVKGDLHVSIAEDGTFWATGIWFSDDQTCLSAADTIPYGWGSCAALKGITVQLGLSWSQGDGISFSDEGVMVYEYDRNSTAPPGAADRVRILNLAANN